MNTTNNNNDMRFSQRKGYVPVRERVQKDGFDQETKNKLWDVIARYLSQIVQSTAVGEIHIENVTCFIRTVFSDILKKPIDEIPEINESYHIDHKVSSDVYHLSLIHI